MKTTMVLIRTSNTWQCFSFCLILLTAGFGFLGLTEITKGVTPVPDGGYPGGNTAEGQNALFSLTTGVYNTALGYFSLRSDAQGQFNTAIGAGALFANVGDPNTGEGTLNTATGAAALFSNTTGSLNTANGAFALFSNTTGFLNTATGRYALFSNTTGQENTAAGASALYNNTTGFQNTADGRLALYSNTTGERNTAVGFYALFSNTTGPVNTADGYRALSSNTTGDSNTAVGAFSLYLNNDGGGNTAFGTGALSSNTSGSSNVAMGGDALLSNNGSNNVAIGALAGDNITTANNVICIGDSAGTNHQTGDKDVYLGNPGVDGESGTVRLGTGDGFHTRMFLAGVHNVTTGRPDGIPVLIDSGGQLGTASSSRRFKHDIKPMDEASAAILSFNPVTFHYKSDKTNTAQFGLIAEEVAKVNPDLVVRDNNGDIYTVRYDAVNAMLLNEFLKEHKRVEQQAREIEAQKDTISDLREGLATVIAQLKEQRSRIEKVSAQLAAASPASGGLELCTNAMRTVAHKK